VIRAAHSVFDDVVRTIRSARGRWPDDHIHSNAKLSNTGATDEFHAHHPGLDDRSGADRRMREDGRHHQEGRRRRRQDRRQGQGSRQGRRRHRKDTSKAVADTAKDTAEKAKDAAATTADKAKESVTALRDKAASEYQTALDALKPKIDAMKAKVDASPDLVKPTLQKAWDGVNTQFKAASDKVSSLKSASGDTWQKLAGELKDMVPLSTRLFPT